MIDIKYCPICKSRNITIIREIEYRYPEKIRNPYIDKRLRIAFDKIAKCDRKKILKYSICRCNDCSFIYSNPRFTNEEVLIKYYWIAEGMGVDLPHTDVTDSPLSWVDEMKEKRIRENLGKYVDTQAKTLLDFGGADGRMCINLRNKYNCEIVEVTDYCLYKKIKYIGKNLESCEGREYDIIFLIDVLEHMNKPLEFITVLKKYLKRKTGVMLIAVPNGHSHEWKYVREPLTHCNYFSQDSLKKLLEIAELEQLEIKEYPFPKFKGEKAKGQIYFLCKRER